MLFLTMGYLMPKTKTREANPGIFQRSGSVVTQVVKYWIGWTVNLVEMSLVVRVLIAAREAGLIILKLEVFP